MNHRRLAIALWATFVFVTWNVMFDRAVLISSIDFTRQQIVRQRQGAVPESIPTGFHPHVRQAALTASGCAGVVLLSGLLILRLTYPRPRT